MSANDRSLLAAFRRMSAARRGVLIVLVTVCGLVFVGRFAKSPNQVENRPGGRSVQESAPSHGIPENDLQSEWQRLKESSKTLSSAVPIPAPGIGGTVDVSSYGAPLIAHAAELAVATKEFSRSRSNLEEILERHHGYTSKLRMLGQPSGSLLTATLRIPSSEFTSTVTDLKTLGTVEREEQTADEITQQRADLEARLANARYRLQQLQGMVARIAKPEIIPLDLQRQLIAAKAEIDRLQSERVSSERQVVFANVLFSLREELTPVVETFATQFRKAAMAGISDALNSLSAIVLFFMSYGPALLLWTLVILLPGRWMWRKLRPPLESQVRSAENS